MLKSLVSYSLFDDHDADDSINMQAKGKSFSILLFQKKNLLPGQPQTVVVLALLCLGLIDNLEETTLEEDNEKREEYRVNIGNWD